MNAINMHYNTLILNVCLKKTFKSEIQRQTDIAYVTITTYMKTLESEGFVKTMQSTDGRCGKMYKITDKGTKFLNAQK